MKITRSIQRKLDTFGIRHEDTEVLLTLHNTDDWRQNIHVLRLQDRQPRQSSLLLPHSLAQFLIISYLLTFRGLGDAQKRRAQDFPLPFRLGKLGIWTLLVLSTRPGQAVQISGLNRA
jgi:hypothetical protein